ncbi:hypothetical protein KM043_000368 [Ampulex compressa]|nr:hypothetical protein KM043_000368 [Ampulex compressa]
MGRALAFASKWAGLWADTFLITPASNIVIVEAVMSILEFGRVLLPRDIAKLRSPRGAAPALENFPQEFQLAVGGCIDRNQFSSAREWTRSSRKHERRSALGRIGQGPRDARNEPKTPAASGTKHLRPNRGTWDVPRRSLVRSRIFPGTFAEDSLPAILALLKLVGQRGGRGVRRG